MGGTIRSSGAGLGGGEDVAALEHQRDDALGVGSVPCAATARRFGSTRFVKRHEWCVPGRATRFLGPGAWLVIAVDQV
jgi:hypothetical protein